jgi:hypothetical protein
VRRRTVRARPEFAFDGLVVFDLCPISALTEELFPGRGIEVSNAWRTQQFEYTWLRTLIYSDGKLRQFLAGDR